MNAEVIGGDGRIKDRTGVAPQGVVFRAKRTTVQACANNVWVDFKPDSKQFDPFNFYDPATGRFQPKIAGYYRLSGCCYQQPGNSTTWTYWRIAKNGGPPNGPAARSMQQQGGTFVLLSGSDILYFNGTTDYATIQVQSDNYATGAGIYGDLVAEDYSWFEAELIGVSAGVIPEPWHKVGDPGEPGFATGWSHNYSATVAPARFMKDPHGFVHLAGSVKSTGAAAPIFTLPVGYRPAHGCGYALSYWTGSTRALGIYAVNPDGTVNAYAGADVVTAMQYATLDVITFRAEG